MKKIKNIGLLLFLILSTLSFSYQVNYDDVVDIVLRNYPQSRVTKIEITNYKGKTVYEGETFNKEQKIEFIIDVNTGEVHISGKNIKNVNTEDLREMTGYVTQETVMFQGTIADNIRVAKQSVKQASGQQCF